MYNYVYYNIYIHLRTSIDQISNSSILKIDCPLPFSGNGRLILADMNRPHMEKRTPELRPQKESHISRCQRFCRQYYACRVQSANFRMYLNIYWKFVAIYFSHKFATGSIWSRFHDILSYELSPSLIQNWKIQCPKITQRCWYPKEQGQNMYSKKQYSRPGLHDRWNCWSTYIYIHIFVYSHIYIYV